MAELSEVRQRFSGNARSLRQALKSVVRPMRRLGEQTQNVGNSAITTENELGSLDNAINKTAINIPPTVEAYSAFERAIQDVSEEATEGIPRLEDLRKTADELGRKAGLNSERLKGLQRAIDDIMDKALGARVNVDELEDVVEALGRHSDISAAQVAFLERAIDDVAGEDDIVSIQRLNEQFREQIPATSLAEDAVSQLSRQYKSLLVDITGANQALSSNQLEMLELRQTVSSAEEVVERLGDELVGVSGAAGVASAGGLLASSMFKLVAESADNAEEEVQEFNRALRQVVPQNPITTLNLGPLNLSLSQMLTTVVSLTVVLGPLIATIGGLAAAFLTVTAAATAFLGVGLLGFLDHIEQRFAGITNRMEAMEALGEGLMMSLREAFQPIFEGQIAGQTPIQFFINTIRGAMGFLRHFAEVAAEIASMDAVAESFGRISEVLSTGDGGRSMMNALKTATESLLPILTDFFVFMVENLPELIHFMTRVAEDVGPAFANIFLALLPVFVELIKFGDMLIQWLSVFVSFVEFLGSILVTVFDIMNDLTPFVDWGTILAVLVGILVTTVAVLLAAGSAVLKAQAAAAVATYGYQALALAMSKHVIPVTLALIETIGTYIGSSTLATASTWTLSGALGALKTAALLAGGAVKGLIASIATLTLPISATAAAILAVVAAIVIVVEWFIGWGEVINWLIGLLEGFLDLLHEVVTLGGLLDPLFGLFGGGGGGPPAASVRNEGMKSGLGRASDVSGGNTYNVTVEGSDNPNRTARKTRNTVRNIDRRDRMSGRQ